MFIKINFLGKQKMRTSKNIQPCMASATRSKSRLFVFQLSIGFAIVRLGLVMVKTFLTKILVRLCQLHLKDTVALPAG